MIQGKVEEKLSQIEKNYHVKQHEKIYRSTEAIVEWTNALFEAASGSRICDFGSGGGANLAYLAQKYPQVNFEGIEISRELVDFGNKKLIDLENARIVKGDWYHLGSDLVNRYKGIISFQTLSWLPEYGEPIRCMTELQPDWIVISSLFYEGDIDYTIQLKDYTRASETREYEKYYYNIYSLNKVKEVFAEFGYKRFKYKRFEIDIDLEKPVKEGLGTYTKKMADGSRIQISGGLMLPWYFILAYK